MEKLVYLNGEYVQWGDAKIHINDRGYCFGDAIYDVVHFRGDKFIDFQDHCERFYGCMKRMKIAVPDEINTLDKIRDIAYRVKKSIPNEYGYVYFQISRGVFESREHGMPPSQNPVFFIYANSRKVNPDWMKNGIKCISHPDMRWNMRDVKTVQLLPNVMAKQRALDAGFDDAILDDNGAVTEGTSSNIFAVKDGVLYTHPRSNKILPGITRKRIIQLAEDAGIEVVRNSFSMHDLKYSMDECFLTNANIFVRPVVQVDSHKIGDGKVGTLARKINELYENFVANVD